MSKQLAFLADPIDEAFYLFHHHNPDVYRTLVRMARAWKHAGHVRCSIASSRSGWRV